MRKVCSSCNLLCKYLHGLCKWQLLGHGVISEWSCLKSGRAIWHSPLYPPVALFPLKVWGHCFWAPETPMCSQWSTVVQERQKLHLNALSRTMIWLGWRLEDCSVHLRGCAPGGGAEGAVPEWKGRLWVPYSSMCSWAVEPGWAARSRSAVEGVPACTCMLVNPCRLGLHAAQGRIAADESVQGGSRPRKSTCHVQPK